MVGYLEGWPWRVRRSRQPLGDKGYGKRRETPMYFIYTSKTATKPTRVKLEIKSLWDNQSIQVTRTFLCTYIQLPTPARSTPMEAKTNLRRSRLSHSAARYERAFTKLGQRNTPWERASVIRESKTLR